MNRPSLLALACFASLSSFVSTEARAQSPKHPNVVIIFIDDLGYGDIGPYGATKQKTPHLDRMATEGMKLTSFYAAPVCSVSRAQVMTGCYGARISVPGVFGPASTNGLHPNEVTIAERLKKLGYATMCIGKWHLGDQPEFLPTKQGFDHYFGIPYSNDMQRKSEKTGENVVPLVKDDQVLELLTDQQQSQVVERYTAEAVKFIKTNKGNPFFLYLPHTAVHTPIWPGEAFRGKSSNGRFGDWVEEVDWSVGQVLGTLRELQLDKNTLVVFTTDNGPWLIKGADGGSALPLRGGKGSTWEGGVRVPTIAWWPGRIEPNTKCDAVAGTIDLMPTAVSIAGGSVPADPVIDGRDISPLLFGKSKESQREAHYYFFSYNLQAVRQGPWKLAIATQPEPVGKDPNEGPLQNPRLYNLDAEIGERTNVADKHPEVVEKLSKLIEKMNAEIGGDSPKSRRPPGIVKDAKTLYPSVAPKVDKSGDGAGSGRKLPLDLSKLKVGDVLTSKQSPRVAGTPFTITCDVKTASADGIILAHGGSAVGYALYFRDGAIVFSINDRDSKHHVSQSPDGVSKPLSVTAALKADGTMELSINSKPASKGKAAGTLSRQPQENFCVGDDDSVRMFDYPAGKPFSGSVENLRISTP